MSIKNLNEKKSVGFKSTSDQQLKSNNLEANEGYISSNSNLINTTHKNNINHNITDQNQSDSSLENNSNINNKNNNHSPQKVLVDIIKNKTAKVSASHYKTNNNLLTYGDHDNHDRTSLSSLVLEDTKSRKDSANTLNQINQRRTSMLRRNWAQHSDVPFVIGANVTESNHGICGKILLGLSWFLMIMFFPFSLLICMKVVQEYE